MRPCVVSAALLAVPSITVASSPPPPPEPAGGFTRDWDEQTATFGLLDRMQLAPLKLVVANEVNTEDDAGSVALTVHLQYALAGDWGAGAYATIPMWIPLEARDAATGRHSMPGTLELGGFYGDVPRGARMRLVRVGVLLPTTPDEAAGRFVSARVGDAVLGLAGATGVRLSGSSLRPWRKVFGETFGADERWRDALEVTTRVDVGIDAVEARTSPSRLSDPRDDSAQHVIARAGAGVMLARYSWTLSIDTVAAIMHRNDRDGVELRWGGGATLRRVGRDSDKREGVPRLQPSLTLAGLRTADGWAATAMIELTITARRYGDLSGR